MWCRPLVMTLGAGEGIIITLTAVVLGVAPAFALAECAWALWVEQPSGSTRWSLSTAVEFVLDTRDRCDRAAATALDARITEVEARERRLGRRLDPPKFFECLPDTVDPRGPKGM